MLTIMFLFPGASFSTRGCSAFPGYHGNNETWLDTDYGNHGNNETWLDNGLR